MDEPIDWDENGLVTYVTVELQGSLDKESDGWPIWEAIGTTSYIAPLGFSAVIQYGGNGRMVHD